MAPTITMTTTPGLQGGGATVTLYRRVKGVAAEAVKSCGGNITLSLSSYAASGRE